LGGRQFNINQHAKFLWCKRLKGHFTPVEKNAGRTFDPERVSAFSVQEDSLLDNLATDVSSEAF